MLTLYNTLIRAVEAVKIPADNKPLDMYTCGPTVYDAAHIGNLRSYIFADVLKRVIEYNGQSARWVMNITDVDDKTIKKTIDEFGAQATVADLTTLTNRYTELFLADLWALNIDTEAITFIKVSEKIPAIQQFIVELIGKGYAYQAEDGSTYFSIEKYQKDFGDYGVLVGSSFLEGKKIGARVKVDEYEKDNLSDFALWKAHNSEEANIFWEHDVLGRGRPGWHIECSVINKEAFGGTADIHTGGVDLIFPHHTNEIAQSQPFYKPFVRHWAHCEHLLVDGKKMAKRDNNFYTLKDIINKGYQPLALRYALLQSHYKTQQNFTWNSLTAARNALEKLQNFARETESSDSGSSQYEKLFLTAINDDLNTPKALGVLFELLGNSENAGTKLQSVLKFDNVLGLGLATTTEIIIPTEMQALLDARENARKQKDYELSDTLRHKIKALGFEVKDTSDGQIIQAK